MATTQPEQQDRLAEYKRRLGNHDWFYEYSDDHGVWRKGSEMYATLRSMQAEMDPDFAIWNTYAPAQYRVNQ